MWGIMAEPLHGLSDASDAEFVAQVEALMDLPLEQRLQGLAAAEVALRERLGSANTGVWPPAESDPPGFEGTAQSE